MEQKFKKLLFDMADSVSLNEEAAKDYLTNQKVDVSSYVKKGLQEIKKREFLNKAENRLETHQELIEKAIRIIKNGVPEAIINLEKAIRIKKPAFQHRNLQELNERQLLEILNDVDLITTIEDLVGLD